MITINANSLKLLAIFAKVVETGSFAAAAQQLGSSRSRISEQVSLLEHQLNVRLLQRSTRQLRLTQEGQTVFDKAQQLELILNDINHSLAEPEPSGKVRITMTHDVAHRFLLPLLPELSQRFRQVTLDLVIDDNPLDLIEQQLDLGIRVGFPKDAALVARPLHQDSFALFASPAFLGRYGEPFDIKSLESLPWVCLRQQSATGLQSYYQGAQQVTVQPQHFHLCDSPLLLQHMAIAGLGVASLFPSTVAKEIRSGQLRRIMPSLASEPLVFSLVYPSRKHVAKRTRAVIDFLLNHAIFNQNG
ncbi:LysR family transcriptional regulator [Pseudoalteromonas fenneropenaei]|uniref:LysR family transcriptional regulator n=1 Tax=Pseudoalteromonas fenneropenaei TaxID=1737459 RepID=A0ABV7CDW2_9GAMM